MPSFRKSDTVFGDAICSHWKSLVPRLHINVYQSKSLNIF